MQRTMLIQCDFDGTITEEDVSFALLDAFAQGDWREWFQHYRQNRISVGEFNTRAFAMVKASKKELLEVVRSKTRVRPGLHELVGYCRSRGFRFVIVSNGLDFYIEAILKDAGLRDIEVYAAKTRFYRRGLKVQYIGPDGIPLMSDFKEAYAKLFLGQGQRLIYVGNGPSDVAPASLAHHIFGKDGLLDGCREMNLECTPFNDLKDIVRGLESL
jgi:2-hydroxy-3-keto-5-methylthiopentenyl-1-phosphate phosphatase